MKIIENTEGRFEKDGVRYDIIKESDDTQLPREYAIENGYELYKTDEQKARISKRFNMVKNMKKREIANARYEAEFGGFTESNSGLFVRTDSRTRTLINSATIRANSDSDYTVKNWKTSDGSFITLDNATIKALDSAMHDFIEAMFEKEAQLNTVIENATTIDELNSIVW